jgi:signal transduction histidine kinase
MDRQTVEVSALVFEAVVTGLLALVYWGLWLQQRRPCFATWALAWAAFAMRLGFISAFVVSRRPIWLFAHQAATSITALLLLWAALQFSRNTRWHRRYLWLGAAAIAWAYVTIFLIHDMRAAGLTAALLLAVVALWTSAVFWRQRRSGDSAGATLLSWTFLLWGLHHLDYPLLRALGSGVLYGVFADIIFIVAATVGTLFLVLADGRAVLDARRKQLEQLTKLLLSVQEEERRKIARELHDEAGQVLTAVKIELDLEGRVRASEMIGRALSQVRDISNLLRPRVLDDLGLLPALRALADDFGRRTRIEITLECDPPLLRLPDDIQVVIYRVVQEALTNVARHAQAHRVHISLSVDAERIRLAVRDDGHGTRGESTPHLGLLGIHERVSALGGTLRIEGAEGHGFLIEAVIPARAVA